MSLTSHLEDPQSPIRQYFQTTFPNLRHLRLPADDPRLPAGRNLAPPRLGQRPGPDPFPAPVVLPQTSGWYPWSTAGIAFDYRVRYLFGSTFPYLFVAADGARLLADSYGQDLDDTAWQDLAQALHALDARLAPRLLPAAIEEQLTRLCVLLAWYEELHRFGPHNPAWGQHPLVLAGAQADLYSLLAAIDPIVVADVTAMTQLTIRTQRELLASVQVVPNPTFARSAELGGADADLIVDGLLLDLKTSKRASLSRDVVWQLLGYLLADTHDRYHLNAVGLYFARHGVLWTFQADDFLRRLAAAPITLEEARAGFVTACSHASAVS